MCTCNFFYNAQRSYFKCNTIFIFINMEKLSFCKVPITWNRQLDFLLGGEFAIDINVISRWIVKIHDYTRNTMWLKYAPRGNANNQVLFSEVVLTWFSRQASKLSWVRLQRPSVPSLTSPFFSSLRCNFIVIVIAILTIRAMITGIINTIARFWSSPSSVLSSTRALSTRPAIV